MTRRGTVGGGRDWQGGTHERTRDLSAGTVDFPAGLLVAFLAVAAGMVEK
jgi:hypothetical protein